MLTRLAIAGSCEPMARRARTDASGKPLALGDVTATVASALAPLQEMLQQIAGGAPARKDRTATTAIPHAARG